MKLRFSILAAITALYAQAGGLKPELAAGRNDYAGGQFRRAAARFQVL